MFINCPGLRYLPTKMVPDAPPFSRMAGSHASRQVVRDIGQMGWHMRGDPPVDGQTGEQGKQYQRLVIRNATVVNGRGTPAEGPVDIVIERDKIVDIIKTDAISLARQPAGWQRPTGERMIDATGMYVLPGLVDMHVHVPLDNHRVGPRGWEYVYKLLLGHGITTIRTCGFGGEETLYEHRRLAELPGGPPIPRMVVLYGWPRHQPFAPDVARDMVRQYRDGGADGIKLIDPVAEVVEPVCDEVRKIGMTGGTAIHLSLSSETDAVQASNAGVTTIEHTYGIPEAALPGAQAFPPEYNEMDELQRFRQSGHNWTEADRYTDRVLGVLDLMIRNGTVWNPTMVVYEANRDLARARLSEWNDKYTTPALLKYWSPKPGVHASFHFDWRTADEIAWKRKYLIWMKYVNEFFARGGILTAGADAGSLYTLYGFSIVRELELFQESGLHPLDIVQIASTNAARVLNRPDLAGGVRRGFTADLAIVDGNPLANFKLMYGAGVDSFLDDQVTKVKAGGVRWTIRAGTVFDARALMVEVEDYVNSCKATE